MPNPGLDDDLIQEAADAFAQTGNKAAAARLLGLNSSTYNHRIRVAAQKGLIGTKPVLPGFEISKTSAEVDSSGKVLRQFIQQKPEKGEEFEVPEGHAVKGVSALVDGQGNVVQQWYKTRADDKALSIEAIRDIFGGFEWKPIEVPEPSETDPQLLTIYPIADLHLGLWAREDESGEEYNLDIAEHLFTEKADRLFLQSPPSGTALVAYLGDWTHQDDDKDMTPSSNNILQVSDDFYSTVRRGVKLAVAHTYKALERHSQVIVKVIKGNHDLTSWVALVVGLEEHFARS